MSHGGDIYSRPIEYDFSVNLNPVDCSGIISEILENSAKTVGHYPDTMQREFRGAIADVYGIDGSMVWGGNGASELIFAIVSMLEARRAMMIEPCFSGYRHALGAETCCEIVTYKLSMENGFALDDAFVSYLELEAQNGLEVLFLTNPNNPTGRLIPSEILLKAYEVCKLHNVKIICDECFLHMTDGESISMVDYVEAYDGLYVINAFTKLLAIPGLRVGYVITAAANISRLRSYLPEWNLSVLSQKAGVVGSRYLRDECWLRAINDEIAKERGHLCDRLTSLGYEVFDSDTGFILIYSENDDIYEYLLDRKILIRDCSDYEGLGTGFFRIAVKNRSENEVLIGALEARR